MIKCIVIGNFRGTCASVKMLKGYMLIFRNAAGVHGKRKVGNPCSRGLMGISSINFRKFGHNFGTRNARKSIKSSKHSYDSLESNKNSSQENVS